MLQSIKFLAFLGGYGIIFWKVLSAAIWMLNQPSNTQVGCGVIVMLGLLSSVALVVPFTLRLARGAWKEYKKEITMSRTNLSLVTLMAASAALTIGCGCTRIDAGNVGIVVNLAGDQRGVQDLPVQTGWVTYSPIGVQVFEYPVYVQTVQWTKDLHEGNPANEEITFTTKEGLVVSADISLSYQLERAKVPDFYVKFRSDDLKTFTHGFLRNVTRDQFNETASKYAIEAIMGDNEGFIAEVRKRLSAQVTTIGVNIQQFGFIGAPRPPQNVIDAINSKIGATQKAIQIENELRQAKGEAEKWVAKAEGESRAAIMKAKGEAEARRITADSEAYTNQVVSKSLSPTLVEYLRAKKWDGKLPQVTSGSGNLLYQLPTGK